MCIGCRADKAREWALRCMHENSLHRESCFLTLTYSEANLPPHGSLRYRDVQLFLKRLRKLVSPHKIRYYLCGEYGEEGGRPHYHLLVFGWKPHDQVAWRKSLSDVVCFESPTLRSLWKHGISTVGEVTMESAGYVARYVMQKLMGPDSRNGYAVIDPETGELAYRAREFNRMSTRAGIGKGWFQRFAGDVFPGDFIVFEGRRYPVPKYYTTLLKRSNVDSHDLVLQGREIRARRNAGDSTPERLKVREEVKRASMRNLKRSSL